MKLTVSFKKGEEQMLMRRSIQQMYTFILKLLYKFKKFKNVAFKYVNLCEAYSLLFSWYSHIIHTSMIKINFCIWLFPPKTPCVLYCSLKPVVDAVDSSNIVHKLWSSQHFFELFLWIVNSVFYQNVEVSNYLKGLSLNSSSKLAN